MHGTKAGIPMETIRLVHAKKGTEHFSTEDAQIVSFVRRTPTSPNFYCLDVTRDAHRTLLVP